MNTPSRLAKAARALRATVGLGVGFVTAVPELGLALVAGTLMLCLRGWSRPEHPVIAAVNRMLKAVTAWEFRRVAGYAGKITVGYTGRRAWLYLAARPWVGLLAGAIGVLIVYGAGAGIVAVVQWVRGYEVDGIAPSAGNLAYLSVAGIVLAFLAVQGLLGVVILERALATRLLGPSREQQLSERVSTLTRSRAAVVEAVDAERRRIERDIHDGVQQRTVALGMLIGRARRGEDPRRREELLAQAHLESQALLSDLREVSWRIYPTALETEGLRVAIESVIDRCAIPVRLSYDAPARLDRGVETAAYFVVCEAVTNAAKHSGASSVDVTVSRSDDRLIVSVRDNGCGGANPEGGGLSGLARRAAAGDGTFTVDSPVGGPTTIEAELPCG
ncbi:sensor histidine kinase [Stackebrandtia nassauensis]|uniref:histidine kinase n=1 Tax=Stackebrandtia nassauensis (strain DSM 44728 / CIP 108903 / NRRL B-16338 / NBRC 102104 / LLR-40K-21) TaxID=446470 RepID=D3Q3I5_STANL|nr:sensor histidine kinase [Stackebrandtia nassauensis]ADD42026.1 histidine kinase [Stackebrandtia nassauensis DSM 44728]